MTNDDKALVARLRWSASGKVGAEQARLERNAADRIEAQAAEIEFHKERADALALQADEWEGKYLIGIAEIERLKRDHASVVAELNKTRALFKGYRRAFKNAKQKETDG